MLAAADSLVSALSAAIFHASGSCKARAPIKMLPPTSLIGGRYRRANAYRFTDRLAFQALIYFYDFLSMLLEVLTFEFTLDVIDLEFHIA